MNAEQFIVLLLVTLLAFTSCSTGPDFERDNENDPAGSDFSPDPPSGENYSINNKGNVILSWEDNTEHEDSYVVYKSIHSDSNFIKIAELEANTTEFLDESDLFGYPTIYKIFSRKEMQESKPIVVTIDMDNFADISVDTDSSNVIIQWDPHFDFGAKFQVKVISVLKNSEIDLATTDLTDKIFKFERPVDDLIYQFVFTLFFQNKLGESYGPNITYDIDLNVSSIKKHQFYSENEVRLIIDNTFAAGSGYKLYKKNASTSTYTLHNTFKPTVDFIPVVENFDKDQTYTYAISTLLNGMESDLQEYTFNAVTPSVKLDEIVSIDQNTVQLRISDTTQIKRAYQIFTSGSCTTNSQFTTFVGLIPEGETTYVDDTLDGESTAGESPTGDSYHCYFIRTKLSGFSNKKRIRFGNTVRSLDSVSFRAKNGDFLSTDINTAGNLITVNSSSKISLYNTSDFTLTEMDNSGLDQIVRISPGENNLLIGNTEGRLKVIDLNSQEVLRNINFDAYGKLVDVRFSLLEDAFLILTEQGFYHLMGDNEVKTLVPSLEINSGYIYVGDSNSLILLGAEKKLYRWDLINGNLNRHNFSLEFNVPSDINHIDYYVSEIRTNYPYTAMVSYVDNAGIDWDIDNGYGFFFEHAFDNGPLTYRRSIYVPKSDYRFTASDYEYHYQRLYNIYQDLITYNETYPIIMEVINLGYLESTELIAMIKKNDSEVIVYLLEPVKMWRAEDVD